MTTYQTENKEPKLMIIIVLGQKYYLAFRKDQFLVHFFLVQFLVNIFLADLFFIIKDIDITSYADDTTPFIVENNIENVIASLEQVSEDLFNWFKNNRLKSNADKCHVLVSTSKSIGVSIGNYTIDKVSVKNC